MAHYCNVFAQLGHRTHHFPHWYPRRCRNGHAFDSGCALINLNGTSTLHFDLALVLLGVGWNFGFIGSTTMLAKAYRPEEASTAQALNEPLVFGTMAVASISSGFLLENIGWESINVMVLPIATAAIALLAWGDYRQRQAKSA